MISKIVKNMRKNNRAIEKLACARKFRLKNNPTEAEMIIRNFLLDNKIPHDFQKIIYTEDKFFIIDFIIHMKPRLIIEIDGASHIGREEYDKNRENIILERKNFNKKRNRRKKRRKQFEFLRIKNEDVFNGKAIEELRKIYHRDSV